MSVTNTTEDQVPYVPASKNIELIKTIKRSTLDDLNFMITKSKEEISNSTNLINSLTERNQFIKTDLLKLGEVKKLLIKLKNSKMIDKKDFILNTINTQAPLLPFALLALGPIILVQVFCKVLGANVVRLILKMGNKKKSANQEVSL